MWYLTLGVGNSNTFLLIYNGNEIFLNNNKNYMLDIFDHGEITTLLLWRIFVDFICLCKELYWNYKDFRVLERLKRISEFSCDSSNSPNYILTTKCLFQALPTKFYQTPNIASTTTTLPSNFLILKFFFIMRHGSTLSRVFSEENNIVSRLAPLYHINFAFKCGIPAFVYLRYYIYWKEFLWIYS